MERKDRQFKKHKETLVLADLLEKYPFKTVLTEIKYICANLSSDNEKEEKYKLAECFKEDSENMRRFLEDIESNT